MPVWEFRPQQYRATVKDPASGRYVSVAKVLGLPRSESTWRNARLAERALQQATQKLSDGVRGHTMTVQAWWDVWTRNELYQRPKPATNIGNRERTARFTARYGALPLADVDRRLVAEWRESGRNEATIKFLRTMFSDACRAELIAHNPFANLGAPKSKGNAQKDPPSIEKAWELIDTAHRICPPGFAAWLQVACFTGMRTCELDALTWSKVDLAERWILVDREFCSRSGTFGAPKNGRARRAPIHQPAYDALVGLPRELEFVFVNGRGDHWTRAARQYQWDRVRQATDWDGSLYVSTRHFAAWQMYVVLRLDAEDVASALGHDDRGQLVRSTYGHWDHERALERVKAAYAGMSA